MLQGQSINLIEAAKESKVVISVLREKRNDQTVWSELFERAKELPAGCEIDPGVPRISAIQRNRANVPAVTPQQYWYRALYLPLVDHLIQELNDRLLNHNDRFLGQYLITTQLGSLNRETTNKIYNAYSNDLSHSGLRQRDRSVESEMGACRGGRNRTTWRVHLATQVKISIRMLPPCLPFSSPCQCPLLHQRDHLTP